MPVHELKIIEQNTGFHFNHIRLEDSQLNDIAELVFHDKKKEGNSLNFSLLKQIGKCEINVQVTKNQIINSLKNSMYGFTD